MNTTSSQVQIQAEPQALIGNKIDIDQTVGATMVGSYLSAIFYGVTLLQTYMYFSRYYGRDSVYLISLVIILTALDTFSVVGSIRGIWFNAIQNFDNPIAALTVDWGLISSLITTIIIGFLVQLSYAYRAYILGGRNILIPGVIIVFGLSGLVLGLIFMSFICANRNFLAVAPKIKFSTASLVCTIVADMVISVSITRCLLQGRQPGLRKSNTLIRKLVIYTVNTGAATTGAAIATLVVSESWKNSVYDIIFYYLLSKCYVNSILGFLNARESLGNSNDPNLNGVSLDHFDNMRPKFRDVSDSVFTSKLVGEVPLDVIIGQTPEQHESLSPPAVQSKVELTRLSADSHRDSKESSFFKEKYVIHSHS